MNFSVKNKIFILLITVLITSVGIVAWYGFNSTKKSYKDSTLTLNRVKTKAIASEMETLLGTTPNDLVYNINFYALEKLLVWEKLKESRKVRYWKTIYISTLKDYIKNKKLYYQVRILDKYGMEKILLKYDSVNHIVLETPKDKLQNKSHRNYFRKTIALKKGEFYISEMNLNVENGEVERPYTPVVRYSAPIIDKNGETVGILVLNFYAENILKIIASNKINKNSSQHYYLINKDGDYLYNEDKSKRWSMQLGTQDNFKYDYKGIFPMLKDSDDITFIKDNKIFSSYKLYPDRNIFENRYWYLISVIDTDEEFATLNEFIKLFILILVTVLILGLYIINKYISYVMNPLNQVTKQLKSLSKGEIKRESIEYKKDDEIGQIVKYTNIIVNTIETTISQANAIANGNFSKDVILLSDRDALGYALIKMTKKLKEISNLASTLSQGDYDIKLYATDSDDEVGLSLINMIEYLKDITKITESISNGNLEVEYKLRGDKDRLGIAILEMISYLKSIVNQANAISKEEFSSNIEVKSKDDELGLAIIYMTDILRKNSIKNIEDIYFSEGIGIFNDELSGISNIVELSKKAITIMSRYVGGSSGVLYTFDKENEILNLIASFAYTNRDNLSNSFKFGEGIVGQVALEREPILLKNIKDSQFEVQSGTTLSRPKEIFTFPLIHEDELYGVIEIMSFDGFSKLHKEYLLKIASSLATILQTANQNGQIQKLLQKSQEAYEELQTQSEELQESNVQMEEQQQQLQEQSRELKIKNDNLAKAKDEIDFRAEELEKASKYKSEFLANMSHELRTPLNSIILLSKLISQNQDNRLSDDDIEKSLVINRAGNDLLLLINDILDLSKVESGNMELVLDRVTTTEILNELDGLFRIMANEKNLNFFIEDNFKSEFIVDKVKLSQVMKNLLSNAFKFTKEGSITLEVTTQDNNIVFKVIDTGIGIPTDKLDTIFDAFKQVDGSISREFGGTGLGLSISKTIVDLFGGDIFVESEFGLGTTFTVILPLDNNQKISKNVESVKNEIKQDLKSSDNSIIMENIKEEDFTENELSQKNILIVDDDSRNIFALTSTLESMDAEVYSAFNGKEAIEILEEGNEHIDLILMDVMMPVMDGLDAIKRIKANKLLKNIPIIAVTAKTMPEDKQACLDAGADEYLSKPLEPSALLSVLRAWIK